jgi:hypothetical protein
MNSNEKKEEKRLRKEYQLYQDDITYVAKYAEKHGLNPSVALSKILSEHNDIDIKRIEENLKIIISLLYGIRKLDKISLEVLNSFCLNANYQKFIPTSEFKAVIIEEAYDEINKEIAAKNIKRSSTR